MVGCREREDSKILEPPTAATHSTINTDRYGRPRFWKRPESWTHPAVSPGNEQYAEGRMGADHPIVLQWRMKAPRQPGNVEHTSGATVAEYSGLFLVCVMPLQSLTFPTFKANADTQRHP